MKGRTEITKLRLNRGEIVKLCENRTKCGKFPKILELRKITQKWRRK